MCNMRTLNFSSRAATRDPGSWRMNSTFATQLITWALVQWTLSEFRHTSTAKSCRLSVLANAASRTPPRHTGKVRVLVTEIVRLQPMRTFISVLWNTTARCSAPDPAHLRLKISMLYPHRYGMALRQSRRSRPSRPESLRSREENKGARENPSENIRVHENNANLGHVANAKKQDGLTPSRESFPRPFLRLDPWG